MALPLSDDFNRTNETPLAGNYTTMAAGGNLDLNTNQIAPSSAASFDRMYYQNVETPTADQWASIDVVTVPAGDGCGLILRASTSAVTGYVCYCYNGDQAYIDRKVATVTTTVGGGSVSYTPTVNLYAEAVGIHLKLRVGSTTVVDTDDSGGIASGRVGLYIFTGGVTANGRLDNFAADNFLADNVYRPQPGIVQQSVMRGAVF